MFCVNDGCARCKEPLTGYKATISGRLAAHGSPLETYWPNYAYSSGKHINIYKYMTTGTDRVQSARIGAK